MTNTHQNGAKNPLMLTTTHMLQRHYALTLLHARSSGVPAGYKLVPIEPSADMVGSLPEAWRKHARAIYAGMIEAAPEVK